MEKLTMTVKEVSESLGISLQGAYQLTFRQDFPVVILGRRKVVPVDGFKRWLDAQYPALAGTGARRA